MIADRRLLKLLLVALLVHILLAVMTMFIYFPGFEDVRQKIKMNFKLNNPINDQDLKRGYLEKPPVLESKPASLSGYPSRPQPIAAIANSSYLNADFSQEQKDLSKELDASKLMAAMSAPEKILAHSTTEEIFRDAVKVVERKIDAPGQAQMQKVLDQQDKLGSEALQDLKKQASQLQIASGTDVDLDPETGMPGFTPLSDHSHHLGPDPASGIGSEPNRAFESLDDFLDIEVSKYTDPASGEKFFRIRIFAKPQAKLEVLPKEVIFLIDSSLSINSERLAEVKKGIGAVLENLNKADVFNVVAFKESAQMLHPSSAPNTPENIAAALAFVGSLDSNRKTDVYTAIKSVTELPLAKTPSNIILISDGKPSQGVVNARQILAEVSRVNQKKKPIFCFSGGAKVNRYLLDFIAYQNRAWSEYVKRSYEIDEGLWVLCEKIKDPILVNLRYQVTGLDDQEIFPVSMPDFYKGAQFTLYGRYEDEDDFVMQILGNVGSKTKELIFKRSLSEAKEAGPEIQRGYAFNKVYHLISRLSDEGENENLKERIMGLSKRYSIITPYSEEVERQDG